MKWLIWLIIIIGSVNIVNAQQQVKVIDWDRSVAMLYSKFQRQHLYFNYGARQDIWGGWQRNYEHDKPGDFFCSSTSPRKLIDKSVCESIAGIYKDVMAISPDSLLINSMHWYSDTLHFKWLDSTEIRNEYFLRYTDQKFVYVISGWWPNFIKIYKAFPDNLHFGVDSLITEVNSILTKPLNIAKTQFSEVTDGKYYLIQGKINNYMVRCYNIKAYISGIDVAPSKNQPLMFSPWYSIIEITYYLNKDFIP
jgi:hypothetical protein